MQLVGRVMGVHGRGEQEEEQEHERKYHGSEERIMNERKVESAKTWYMSMMTILANSITLHILAIIES